MAPPFKKNRVGKPSAKPGAQRRKRRDPGPGSAMLSRIIDEIAKKQTEREAESEAVSEEYSVDSANGFTLTITHGSINDSRLLLQSPVNGSMLAQNQVNLASPLDKDAVNGTAAFPQGCAEQSGLPTEYPDMTFKNAPSDPGQLGAWIGQMINDIEKDPGAGKIEKKDSSSRYRSPRTHNTQIGDEGRDVLKEGKGEKGHQTRMLFCKQEGNLNKESLSPTLMPDDVRATRKLGAALDNNKGSEALRTLTSGCREVRNQTLDSINSITCGDNLSPKASGPTYLDSSDSTSSRDLSELTSRGATSPPTSPPTSQDPETPNTSTGHNHKSRSSSTRRKRSLRSSTAQDQRITFSSKVCGDLTMASGSSRQADLADPFGAETAALFLGPPPELPTPTTSQPQGMPPPAESQLRRLAPAPTGPSASNVGGGDYLRVSDRSTEDIIAAYERIPQAILAINGCYFGPLQGEPQAYISPIDRSTILPLPAAQPKYMTVVSPQTSDMPRRAAQSGSVEEGIILPPISEIVPPAAQLRSNATRHLGMTSNHEDSMRQSRPKPASTAEESPVDGSIVESAEYLGRPVAGPPVTGQQRRGDGDASANESVERRSAHDNSTISPPSSPKATQVPSGADPRIPQGQTRPFPQHAIPGSNNMTTQEWTRLLREDDPRVDVDLTRNIKHIIRVSMASQDQSRGLPRGTSLAWCTGSMDGRRHLQELQGLMIVIGPHSSPFIPRTREVGKAMMKLVHILNGEGDSPFAAIMRPPPYTPRTATRRYQGGQPFSSTFGSPAGPSAPLPYTHGSTTQTYQGRHPSNAFVDSEVGPSAPSLHAHSSATQTYRGWQSSSSARSSQYRLIAPSPYARGSTTQVSRSGEPSNATLGSQAQPSAPLPYTHGSTTQTHQGGQSSNSASSSQAGPSEQKMTRS